MLKAATSSAVSVSWFSMKDNFIASEPNTLAESEVSDRDFIFSSPASVLTNCLNLAPELQWYLYSADALTMIPSLTTLSLSSSASIKL